MLNWLNTAKASYLKVILATFITVIAGKFVESGGDVFSVTSDDLVLWATAAVSALIPIVINWLNPADSRYGRTDGE